MKLQQYLLNNYLHIPFEDFSHRIVSALGILESIKENPMSMSQQPNDKKPIDDAIEKVNQIIMETNPKIKISLFILDRNILPQDQMKEAQNLTIKFSYEKAVNGQQSITLKQNEIQNYLCIASKEVHSILMRHIAKYSEEMFFDSAIL